MNKKLRKQFSRVKGKSVDPGDDEKQRKRDKVSRIFRRGLTKKEEESELNEIREQSIEESEEQPPTPPPDVETELSYSSSQTSSSEYAPIAKPSEPCRYAAQLRGDRPALEGNFPVTSLCGQKAAIMNSLRISDDEIPPEYRIRTPSLHEESIVEQNIEPVVPPVHHTQSPPNQGSVIMNAGGPSTNAVATTSGYPTTVNQSGAVQSTAGRNVARSGEVITASTAMTVPQYRAPIPAASAPGQIIYAPPTVYSRAKTQTQAQHVCDDANGVGRSPDVRNSSKRRAQMLSRQDGIIKTETPDYVSPSPVHTPSDRGNSKSSNSTHSTSSGGPRNRRTSSKYAEGTVSSRPQAAKKYSGSSNSASSGGISSRRVDEVPRGLRGAHVIYASGSGGETQTTGIPRIIVDNDYDRQHSRSPSPSVDLEEKQNRFRGTSSPENVDIVHNRSSMVRGSPPRSHITSSASSVSGEEGGKIFIFGENGVQTFRGGMPSKEGSTNSRRQRADSRSESEVSDNSASSTDSDLLPLNMIKLKGGRTYQNTYDYTSRRNMGMRF